MTPEQNQRRIDDAIAVQRRRNAEADVWMRAHMTDISDAISAIPQQRSGLPFPLGILGRSTQGWHLSLIHI